MEYGKIETNTDTLLAELLDGVLILTMNRPKAKNALTLEMLSAMNVLLGRAEANPKVKCVVLTGAGAAFCSGGDVKAFAKEATGDAGEQVSTDAKIHNQRLSQRNTSGRLYSMPKPTMAVLPGAAAGAGLSLALACDLRLISEKGILTTAFAKVGLSGDYGGTFLLSRLVGKAKASELYFLSDRIDAHEALSLGLVNWVCPDDQVQEKAMNIARRLAEGPSVAYRHMKENLNRAVSSGDLLDCMDLEATHHISCFETHDHKNAAIAFAEKRQPSFKGH